MRGEAEEGCEFDTAQVKTEEDEFHWLTRQYTPVQCSCKKSNWIMYWVTSTLRFKSNDSDWISIKIPS